MGGIRADLRDTREQAISIWEKSILGFRQQDQPGWNRKSGRENEGGTNSLMKPW